MSEAGATFAIAPNLAEVLEYEHPGLVTAYAKVAKISHEEAEELFVDLKKWLWFLAQRDAERTGKGGFPTMPEQAIIDLFWHQFILDTQAYQSFCDRFFGRFIHHVPTPEGMYGQSTELARTDPERYAQVTKRLLADAMEEVYLTLGRETMFRWFVDLPRRYPPVRIN